MTSLLARQLHDRVDTARDIPFLSVQLHGWIPVANKCHENVDVWLQSHPQHKAMRGWLVLDLGNDAYHFLAHSIIEQEDGSLVDITPPDSCLRFIPHHGPDSEVLDSKNSIIRFDPAPPATAFYSKQDDENLDSSLF